MPSFSSDSCASSSSGQVPPPPPFSSPLPPPQSSAFSAPFGDNSPPVASVLPSRSAPFGDNSPPVASVLPSRLRFSPPTEQKAKSSTFPTSDSSSVPQQNGTDKSVPKENLYVASTSWRESSATSAFPRASNSNRASLDGSFRIIGTSSSTSLSSRATIKTRNFNSNGIHNSSNGVHNSSNGVHNSSNGVHNSSNGVHNSTPLSPEGKDGNPFDLRCSGIASPIFRASQSSTPTGDNSRRLSMNVSGLSACSAPNLQGSQLSKELVFNHSYVPPKRVSVNPLGIYARRPINQRSKNLPLFDAFSTSRVTSAFTPVLSRVQDGIRSVYETMSPRKRSQSRLENSPHPKEDPPTAPIVPETLETPPKLPTKKTASSTRHGLLFIVLAFVASLMLLYFLYTKTPQLTAEERVLVKYPRSLDDAKGLAKVLSAYKDDHFEYIVLGFFAIYNFLQTFAIPGSIFLSILSGFLFPFPLACFLVSLCSALGASFCYLLSSFVGRPIMQHYFASRVEEWRQHVDRHRHNLLSYIIFLRITPFLPNWFINITSPIINVPLTHFFLGTFIGVAPPSFVYISAGQTVHTLTSTSAILTWDQIGLLAIVALISLLPVLLKDKLKQKFA